MVCRTMILTSVSNADPDWILIQVGQWGSRQAKVVPQKEISYLNSLSWAGGFFWSLNFLCRISRNRFIIQNLFYVMENLGLDPDLDWIRIQQQRGSGFSSKFDPDSKH